VDADKNTGSLYTLTLHDISAAAADDVTRQSISASVDYLIWIVDSAANEEDVRTAKLLLEKAIEAYVDEVASRIHGGTSLRQRVNTRGNKQWPHN
jgi:hypothetical protein